MNTFFRFIPLILWSIIIFNFSSQTSQSVAETKELDILIHKLAHLFVFMVHFVTAYFAIKKFKITNVKKYTFPIMISTFYGITDEIHQVFTPTRGPRISDMFVDFAGVILGYILLRLFDGLKKS